jgi:sec-independent protein translocase protein TatA
MPFGIGPVELIIVLVIALLVFGPKKLPELGRSLGGGMREFKDSITGGDKDDDDDETPKLAKAADEVAAASEKTDAAGRPRG